MRPCRTAVRVCRPAWIVTVRSRLAVRNEFRDAPTGLDPNPVRYGQGSEHDGQVGVDGVAGAVVDRAGLQVVFGHPEGLLDAPQLLIGTDDKFAGSLTRLVV